MPISLQLVVDLGVVDDFAQQVDVMSLEMLGRGIGQVDRALHPVAKTERLRQFHREAVGRKVRLGVAQVIDDGAPVMAFHLFLHQLHDLRGAEINALFGLGRYGNGGQGVVGHASSNRDRSGSVK